MRRAKRETTKTVSFSKDASDCIVFFPEARMAINNKTSLALVLQFLDGQEIVRIRRVSRVWEQASRCRLAWLHSTLDTTYARFALVPQNSIPYLRTLELRNAGTMMIQTHAPDLDLGKVPRLVRLSLQSPPIWGSDHHDQLLRQLHQQVSLHTHLVSVRIAGYMTTANGWKSLAGLNVALEALGVSSIIDPGICSSIRDTIARHGASLTRLDVRGSRICCGALIQAMEATGMPVLDFLSISFLSSRSSLGPMVRSCPRLTAMRITNYDGFNTSSEIRELIVMMRSASPSLTALSLVARPGQYIEAHRVTKLLKSCPGLNMLVLDGFGISSPSLPPKWAFAVSGDRLEMHRYVDLPTFSPPSATAIFSACRKQCAPLAPTEIVHIFETLPPNTAGPLRPIYTLPAPCRKT